MSDDSSAPDAAARVAHGQGKKMGGGEFRFCRLVFDGSVDANLFKDLVLMVAGHMEITKKWCFFKGVE